MSPFTEIRWIIFYILLISHNSRGFIELPKNEFDICKSMEIWSPTDKGFDQLKNCTVVEGYVRFVYFDFSKYANVTFHNVREITDYLFLYRVSGLSSISHIFPNLSVIRGNNLFENFALIVFETRHLKEVGLTSLTNILKGGVFIAKNPSLCYVDTIDWNLLAGEQRNHFISRNKDSYECPLCPKNLDCPTSAGKVLCWNENHCQRTCPQNCSSCNDQGCCHSNCLGGCFGPDESHCFACKNFLSNGKCEGMCPQETYKYLERRCISETECYNIHKPLYQFYQSWKPLNDTCMLDCPPGYHEQEIYLNNRKHLECLKCERGKCRKECPSAIVTSAEDAEKLKDCTVIKGALIIRVSGSTNIIEQLEYNLGGIEEITDYLKVIDSFQLTSLNFLKNLKKINGVKRERSKYSLVVIENKNLELLWDWQHREQKLQINGSLLFHLNPKLCLIKIQELISETVVTDIPNSFLPDLTNGVKMVCNVTKLDVKVYNINSTSVVIVWEQFVIYDGRKLLGYSLYLKEAPFKNISIYDRNACGGGGWNVNNVSPSEGKLVNYTINHLKPYTQYAFYVKTFTVRIDREAQSEINYFRTFPGYPSNVRSLKAESNSSNELIISWMPPTKSNGNITHYRISVYRVEDINSFEDSCADRGKFSDNSTSKSSINNVLVEDHNFYLYSHGMDHVEVLTDEERERARQRAIDFEDQIHNQIYIKRGKERTKRYLFETNLLSGSEKDLPTELILNKMGEFLFRDIVTKTTYHLKELKHFTKYKIEVEACREWEPGEDTTLLNNCSSGVEVVQRTLPLPGADMIPPNYPLVLVSNKTIGSVTFKWQNPVYINGFIKSFIVEYKKVELSSYIVNCVGNRIQLLRNSFTVQNLSPGNYSVRLKVVTIKGEGPYTPLKYFSIQGKSLFTQYIYWVIGAVICISPPVLFFMLYYIRSTSQKTKLIITVNPDYAASSYVADSWEIPRSQIEILNEIGQGSFGMVYEGMLNREGDICKKCAIKTVNTQASEREKMEFLNEASVMKAFDTFHVVKLLGVVSKGEPPFVVMELMTKGDLKSFLRSCRPDSADPHIRPPSFNRLLQMSAEIADGMAYLSAKKYVHRDLAARNCMVAEDLTVKIGDFGMARDIYEGDYYRKGSKGLMPVRWMAPESLRDGIFLTLSDVWSYGIVLYEIVTLAAQPYQGLTNDQVLRYILDGGIIERPEGCPDRLYTLMRKCWRQKPSNRPSFLELVSFLYQDVSLNFRSVSFYDSSEGKELRRSLETFEL